MKAREFKSNKRIGQPEDLPEAEESQIIKLKTSVDEEIRKFEAEKKQEKSESNLTKEQLLGKKEIQRGIKELGWHLSTTDKSQRQVLGLADKYREAVAAQTEGDVVVDLGTVAKLEEEIYDHTAAILRIFKFGRDKPEESDKILQALKPVFSAVPARGGQWKDHKQG